MMLIRSCGNGCSCWITEWGGKRGGWDHLDFLSTSNVYNTNYGRGTQDVDVNELWRGGYGDEESK